MKFRSLVCTCVLLTGLGVSPATADVFDIASLRTPRNFPMSRKPTHLPYLIKAFSDRESTVRKNVIRDATFIARRYSSTTTTVQNLLIKALQDEDRNIRIASAFELSDLGFNQGAVLSEALSDGLVDPRAPIRRRAASSTSNLKGDVTPELTSLLVSRLADSEPQVRVAASTSLRTLGLGLEVDRYIDKIRARNIERQKEIVAQSSDELDKARLTALLRQQAELERSKKAEEDRIKREEAAKQLLARFELQREQENRQRELVKARMSPEFQVQVASFEEQNRGRFSAAQGRPTDPIVEHWMREYRFFTSQGNLLEANKRLEFIEERQGVLLRTRSS